MRKGFTLIEIIVVMVIIGILACIAVPSYNSFMLQGEQEAAQNSLLAIKELQQNYYFNNGHYCINAGNNPTCADNLADINKNLQLNIVDNYYQYACAPCTSGTAYCCTATGVTGSQLSVTQQCGGVYQGSGSSNPPPPPPPTPINCVGAWSGCSVSCGTGAETYSITTQASNGGTVCPYSDGETKSCSGADMCTGKSTCYQGSCCTPNCVGKACMTSDGCGGEC